MRVKATLLLFLVSVICACASQSNKHRLISIEDESALQENVGEVVEVIGRLVFFSTSTDDKAMGFYLISREDNELCSVEYPSSCIGLPVTLPIEIVPVQDLLNGKSNSNIRRVIASEAKEYYGACVVVHGQINTRVEGMLNVRQERYIRPISISSCSTFTDHT